MKTLAEIAIDEKLVSKADVRRAAEVAEKTGVPLVVALVRELGVDELALVRALRRHARVVLLDPAETQTDADALREVPKAVAERLRALPISLTADGAAKVLRVALADPTDAVAIAELEQVSHCEIDVTVLPLSAIDELIDKGYRAITTQVVARSKLRPFGANPTVSTAQHRRDDNHRASDTQPAPLTGFDDLQRGEGAAAQALDFLDDLDAKVVLRALVELLVGKQQLGTAELQAAVAEALRRARS